MTEAEKDAETGALIKRYEAVNRTIACLRERSRTMAADFRMLSRALARPEEIEPAKTDKAFDLMGVTGQPRVVVDEEKLRATLTELRESLDDKAQMDRSLRQLGLEGLIK